MPQENLLCPMKIIIYQVMGSWIYEILTTLYRILTVILFANTHLLDYGTAPPPPRPLITKQIGGQRTNHDRKYCYRYNTNDDDNDDDAAADDDEKW